MTEPARQEQAAISAKPAITLRPYQVEAKRAIYAELRVHRSTLLVLATGLGKTATAAEVVADGVRMGRSILVLAHRDELLAQLREAFERSTGGYVGMELGKQRDASQPHLRGPGQGRVIVSSVQTLRNRLDAIPSDTFDLVIIDEFHHARSPSYEKIIRHFDAKLLGLTATPERGDKKALGEVVESVAYDMPLFDGIREGWLVPIHQKKIGGVDLSKVKKRAGDFAADQLAEVMESLDMLRAVSVPTVANLAGRQALVFCVSVKHAILQAESIREVMREKGMTGKVACVTGETPTDIRREMFAEYRRGEIMVLTGCEVFLEGTDLPTSSLGVMARPTMSRVLYIQMLGRLSRALPGIVDAWPSASERRAAIAASAKPFALVLDLVDNSGKHDIVKATDLLDGGEEDPDIKEAERILARGETDDLMKAIEMARAARFGRERARLARDGDFFALFGLVRETDRWGREITESQRASLVRGTIPLAGIDRRGASQAIAEIVRRQAALLCTYKQARALCRWGVPLEYVERFTFAQASAALSNLAAAGWKPGDGSWWRNSAVGNAPSRHR